MPLHWDDCGFLADTIEENINGLWADLEESEKEYWLALAERFRESMETGIVNIDEPFHN